MVSNVDEATNDLLHALGNFLGIVEHERKATEYGGKRLMWDSQLGRFAMEREPALREALDKLKHARNVERIESDDD